MNIRSIPKHFSDFKAYSGVSSISFFFFWGGVQKFSGKVVVCAWRETPYSAWQNNSFAIRVRGHAPLRKF